MWKWKTMADSPAIFTTIDDYLFKTPLYTLLKANQEQLNSLRMMNLLVDGYCPECRQMRTFSFNRQHYSYEWWRSFDPETDVSDEIIDLKCARFENHQIRIVSRISNGGVQKIGQFPSFADISIDESKAYSKLLSKEDAAEFHKALGLAAHGVGIGSFVYIRRIFERLIQNRFDEFKDVEGWNPEEFRGLRIKERIEFLNKHLPDFLVRNAKVYSILSVGIHELTEQQCLAVFDTLRMSTVIILEEDRKKKEELTRQRELEKAIAKFENPAKEEQPRTQAIPVSEK